MASGIRLWTLAHRGCLPGEGGWVGGAAARAGSGGTPGGASACGTSAAEWPTGWVHPPAGGGRCLGLGRLHWVWGLGRSVTGFGCVVIWMLVPDCGFKRRRGFAGVPTIRTAHGNAAVFWEKGLPRPPWAGPWGSAGGGPRCSSSRTSESLSRRGSRFGRVRSQGAASGWGQ